MAYSKTNWEDLPSTSTPVNATNLNKIENELVNLDKDGAIISISEPTDKKKIWIQASKNLFDQSTYIKNIEQGLSVAFVLQLDPNTQYTMSSNIVRTSNNALLFFASGTSSSGLTTNTNGVWEGQSRTFTSDSSGYVTVAYRKLNSTTEDLTTFWYQIEKGSSATTYNSYVDDKTFILNSNNKYEEYKSYEKYNVNTLSGGASINSTYWRNRLVREGKICHLELAIIPNSTSLITILKLPESFYSTGYTATIGLIMRDSAIGKAVLTNNGEVQIQVPSSSGSTWSLNMTWTVD